MESKTIRGFKVITNSDRSKEFQPSAPISGLQQALFPFDTSHLLIFVLFPDVSEDEFVSTLNNLHPGVILELRKAPRFDVGKLNRQITFDYFQRIGSRYFDLNAEFPPGEVNEQQLFAKLMKILSDHINDKSPFMFLVSGNDLDNLQPTVLEWLKTSGKEWNIFCVPHHGSFNKVSRISTP